MPHLLKVAQIKFCLPKDAAYNASSHRVLSRIVRDRWGDRGSLFAKDCWTCKSYFQKTVFMDTFTPPHPPPWPFSASLLREGSFMQLLAYWEQWAVICRRFFATIILNLWFLHLDKKVTPWLRLKGLEGSKDTPIKACSHIERSSQEVSHFIVSFCVVGWFEFENLKMKRHLRFSMWRDTPKSPQHLLDFGGFSWLSPFWGLTVLSP